MSPFRRVAWVVLAAVLAPAAAPAGPPQAVLVRAFDESVPTTRTYFVGEAASDLDAVEFRLRLIDAGARNVNLFLPDRVIVCDLPDRPGLALDIPAGFARATSLEVESQSALTYRSWSWIVEAYRNVDHPPALTTGGNGDGVPFDDVVITTTPEEIEVIERHVEKSRALRGLAPRAQEVQDVAQSSSFLGGSVTANFIFTESDGSLEDNLESWSDEDLAAAKQGAVEAMIAWQSFPKMDLNFAFEFQERVPTAYEPITHTMGNDAVWMMDALRSLGWGHGTDIQAAVHEYNQDRRAFHRTQWVFSAFIACSRNTPNNRFGSGTADYTAYAYLGGPCMVQPYPSGSDYNGVGERLVYSQIVNHEVGHCFWTLDEYPGAPGGCGNASGYLNYTNGNISTLTPAGDELRCNALQECLMHTAARKNINPRPWCNWSRGHLGVIDNNSNGTPDIFEARPRIEFIPEGPDTVLDNQYTLRFRVVATAVPNRNPRLAPGKRVDYATPVKEAWIMLGGTRIDIEPKDGAWGGLVEEFEFNVELAQVGMTAFGVEARNSAGYKANPVGKLIHFVGVNYMRTAVVAKHNRNTVTWEIAGNPFGATFDVYRLEADDAMPGTLIRQNVGPAGPPKGGFIPYQYEDHDIVPGREYRYYVEGGFSLAYEGGTRDYTSRSNVIDMTSMIPVIGDVISHVAPNPTRGAVTLSVSIPRTYTGPERALVRAATPVDVSIYGVNGQLVQTLASGSSLEDVMTLRWDGYTRQNLPAPSGIYFVRASAGSTRGYRKIVLIR